MYQRRLPELSVQQKPDQSEQLRVSEVLDIREIGAGHFHRDGHHLSVPGVHQNIWEEHHPVWRIAHRGPVRARQLGGWQCGATQLGIRAGQLEIIQLGPGHGLVVDQDHVVNGMDVHHVPGVHLT